MVPFPYNNIKDYSVGHAALSGDGQTLYFTSDMPGGHGGTDIWYSGRQSDGSWGRPGRTMRDNPTLKIELSSHTDSRGSDTYNEATCSREQHQANRRTEVTVLEY